MTSPLLSKGLSGAQADISGDNTGSDASARSFSARASARQSPGFDPNAVIATLFAEAPTLESLSQSKQSSLRQELGEKTFQEFLSLSQETDPILFCEGLLALGGRLEAQDKLNWATKIYSAIPQMAGSPPVIAKKAEQRFQAAVGQGAFGSRFEFLLQRFTKDATDYKMIVPMLAGTAVSGLVKTAVLGRFAAMSGEAWYTKGIGAKLASSFLAYGAEVPTFALAGRALRHFGPHPSNGQDPSLGQELASSAITLGLLKTFSFLGNQGYAKLHGVNELGEVTRFAGLAKFDQTFIGQASMFAGMLAGHKAEERLGLRQHVDGATTLTDTLASMVSMGVGAHLGNKVIGEGYTQWHQELGIRTQAAEQELAKPRRLPGALRSPLATPMWMLMGLDGLGGFGLGGDSRPSENPLRKYQRKMLQALNRDMKEEVSPWLGLAAPMQTGKSYLIGPMIHQLRQKFGPEAQVVVLSSARIITDQLLKDLVGHFEEPIGRFDGLHKEVRPITVASVWSMAKNLEAFPTDGTVLLINDEAYFTQSPTFRSIYTHFGLGEVQEIDGQSRMLPKAGNGLAIGLSGTGGGLEGYHVSDQINLLEAIKLGAIRQMRGDRVIMSISSEEKRNPGEEQMVWWQATPANAEALADLYADKIHGKFFKSLVFVPTIEHGELLLKALRKKFGKRFGQNVHSQMGDGDFFDSLEKWEKKGGPLISVRRLGRGFRGVGTEAVFHTYQTNSPELYAQRTGRAWAKTEAEMPDLYVLEVAWNPRGSFANLARLLGLIDYPGSSVSSRKLRPLLEKQKKHEAAEQKLADSVRRGEVSPVFVGIPLEEKWRQSFMDLVECQGGIPALAQETGLDTETLAGFSLGALPVRLRQVEKLQGLLGGENEAKKLWVQAWSRSIDEALGGRLRLQDLLAKDLYQWRERWNEPKSAAKVSSAAEALDSILHKNLKFLGATLLRRRSATLNVTPADLDLLKEAVVAFWQKLTVKDLDPTRPSPVTGFTVQELARRLAGALLNDSGWRVVWKELANHFQAAATDRLLSSESRENARIQVDRLIQHFFKRQSWDPFPKTARQRLLYEAQRAVALKFGSSLPIHSGIEGIGNHEFTVIQKWLQGEEIKYVTRNSPSLFYERVISLLRALAFSELKIRSIIVPAVFEERGWQWAKPKTAEEALLQETRYWIAAKLGGVPPRSWDFVEHRISQRRVGKTLNVEEQDEWAEYKEPLYRDERKLIYFSEWLQTGKWPGVYQKDPHEFYTLLTRLLLDLRADPRRVIPLIYSSVVEQRDNDSSLSKEIYGSYIATLDWLQTEYGKILRQVAKTPPLEPYASEQHSDPFQSLIGKKLLSQIVPALRKLTPIEVRVVRWAFGLEGEEELTFKAIGDKYNLSRERMRQIFIQALDKLKIFFKSFIFDDEISTELKELNPLHEKLYSFPFFEHFVSTRYRFPSEYPGVLRRVYWEFLTGGVEARDLKKLDEFLDGLVLDGKANKLLKYEFIREDIRVFLNTLRARIAFKALPEKVSDKSALPQQYSSESDETQTSEPRIPAAPASLIIAVELWKNRIPFLESTAFLLRGLSMLGPDWAEARREGERLLEKIVQARENFRDAGLTERAVVNMHDAILTHRVREQAGPQRVLEELQNIERSFDQGI